MGGVLFDVDGTLVDSTYLHTLCWWQAFRRGDIDVPMRRIHRAIGMGADQLVPYVLDGIADAGDDEIADFAAAHDAIYATHWPELRPFAAARDLVRATHDAGASTVLASSAGADEVEVLRRLLDADDWLDVATSSADGEHSKPAPDLVSVAMEKAQLSDDDSVFVGDAVWDVEACARAGIPCVGLECGGTSSAELADAGAVAVYADPGDLLARLRSSPLARVCGTD